MNFSARVTLFSVAAGLLSGCSYLPTIPYLNENQSAQPAEMAKSTPPEATSEVAAATTKIPVQALDTTLASSDVEILWEVPEDTVDGFVVKYGDSRDQLSNEVKVPTADLEIRSDQERGKIYRHVLRNIPANKAVFVNIAAYRGAEVSPASRVFEVPPADATAMAQPGQLNGEKVLQ